VDDSLPRLNEKEMAMRAMTTTFKDGLMIGGSAILLLMAFPLIVLLFFTMRFVVVVGGVIALVGACVAYALSNEEIGSEMRYLDS